MSKSKYGTSGGVELTDALIERLADEAEEGYETDQLRPRARRGRPPIQATSMRRSRLRAVRMTTKAKRRKMFKLPITPQTQALLTEHVWISVYEGDRLVALSCGVCGVEVTARCKR